MTTTSKESAMVRVALLFVSAPRCHSEEHSDVESAFRVSAQQQIPRCACMVLGAPPGGVCLRAPGWSDIAVNPPWLMDGLSQNSPPPPPTSMRNLAANGYGPRTADLDTSLRRWESTPAMHI